jgi:hypothetical protein
MKDVSCIGTGTEIAPVVVRTCGKGTREADEDFESTE